MPVELQGTQGFNLRLITPAELEQRFGSLGMQPGGGWITGKYGDGTSEGVQSEPRSSGTGGPVLLRQSLPGQLVLGIIRHRAP